MLVSACSNGGGSFGAKFAGLVIYRKGRDVGINFIYIS